VIELSFETELFRFYIVPAELLRVSFLLDGGVRPLFCKGSRIVAKAHLAAVHHISFDFRFG